MGTQQASDEMLARDLLAMDLHTSASARHTRGLAHSDDGLPLHRRAAVNPSQPPIRCPICFELCSVANISTLNRCNHTFCSVCLRRHVSAVVEQRRFPVVCPLCRAPIATSLCRSLIVGPGEAFRNPARPGVTQERLRSPLRCANPECGLIFNSAFSSILTADSDSSSEIGGHSQQHNLHGQTHSNSLYRHPLSVACPTCRFATCPECNRAAHPHTSCELVRNPQRQWRACPRCGTLVARSTEAQRCSFTRCQCGCAFCAECGREYITAYNHTWWLLRWGQSMLRRGNAHGVPACQCADRSYELAHCCARRYFVDDLSSIDSSDLFDAELRAFPLRLPERFLRRHRPSRPRRFRSAANIAVRTSTSPRPAQPAVSQRPRDGPSAPSRQASSPRGEGRHGGALRSNG